MQRLTDEQRKWVEGNLEIAIKAVRKYCQGWGLMWCRADLYGEAFLALCKAASSEKFDQIRGLKNWASICCRNHLFDVKKGMQYRLNQTPQHKLAKESRDRNSEEEFSSKESRDRQTENRWEEIKVSLEPEELEVVELVAQGKSHVEVGSILRVAPTTVCHRLVRARKRLGVYSAH